MPWYKKTIVSGSVTEVYTYFCPRKAGAGYLPRRGREHLTGEEKRVINLNNARRQLARRINANFTDADVFVRLSYKRKGIERERAIADRRRFLRRLKYYVRAHGLPELKYIAVTEAETGKPHHHLVINFTDLNVLRELWQEGGIYSIYLYDSEYEGLARYITKETVRLERGKRWSMSRNLKKPEVDVRELKKQPRSCPRIPKGHVLLESQCYTDVFGHLCYYAKSVKRGGFYESDIQVE